MSIDTIGARYEVLRDDLKRALSTMELSDKIMKIREEIHDLQLICPHNSGSFDFS